MWLGRFLIVPRFRKIVCSDIIVVVNYLQENKSNYYQGTLTSFLGSSFLLNDMRQIVFSPDTAGLDTRTILQSPGSDEDNVVLLNTIIIVEVGHYCFLTLVSMLIHPVYWLIGPLAGLIQPDLARADHEVPHN